MKAEWVAGDGSPSARQLVRRDVALGFGFPFFNVYEPLSFSETSTPYARCQNDLLGWGTSSSPNSSASRPFRSSGERKSR